MKWRILILDTKRSNPNHYICLAIVRAMQSLHDVEIVVRADYATAIGDAVRNRCNLFIAFDGEELDVSIAERVAQVCGRSALWVTEDPYENSVNVASSRLFDLVFTNDAASAPIYSDKGVALALAADELFHFHKIPQADQGHYLYDLFFAGTAWPNRSEFLQKLQDAIPDINLKLALPANPYIPAPKLGMDVSAYDWRTPNTEFAKFANRSRSVLTLHRAFSSSGNNDVSATPGPRFFEVALAGGFQLVDMSIPDIRVQDYYEEGRDFVGFDGPDDCVEKLGHYLANPHERLAIARSAQQVTLERHLYRHRAGELLQRMERVVLQSSEHVSSTSISGGRRRVLVVSHNILGVVPYGGVEVYQDCVRQALGGSFDFLFYTPDRSADAMGGRYTLRNDALEIIETFEFASGLDEGLLSCPERESAFSEMLYRYGVELVHFQHLIGHPPSLGYLPSSLGIKSILSLHDYHAVCSRFNLLDYRGVYCDIPKLPIQTCDVCLNATQGSAAGSQARRRAFLGRMLEQIDVLHANTDGVADLYMRIYPALEKKQNICVNAVPMPKCDEVSPSPVERATEGPLRIAVPGNFTRNKGGNELVHAFNQLRDDDVEFTIVGPIAAEYEPILEILKIPNLKVHGSYTPGTLQQILAGHDLSIHFSIWPETYCISLSEAWAAGLVPIVADIGALGERVEHGVNGYKVPHGEAGSLVNQIRSLISDRVDIERIRTQAQPEGAPHHDQHMRWLAETYQALLPDRAFRNGIEGRSRGNTVRDLGILLVEPSWIVKPRAATVIGGADLMPVTPPGLLRRTLGYLKRHGVKSTAARGFQEIARRMGGRQV